VGVCITSIRYAVIYSSAFWDISGRVLVGKGKGAVPQWDLGEVLISQTSAVEAVGG